MSPSSTDMRRARAAAEAAEWMARLDEGNLSAAERNEFMGWLRESPVHVSETLRIGRLTSDLSKFSEWDRVSPAGDVSVAKLTHLPTRPAVQEKVRYRRARRIRRFAAAVVLIAIAVFVVTFKQQLSATDIRTQIGEVREITLADGSIVQLSPSTELRIRLRPSIRSVTIQHGEAAFRVARDPARPFIVDASSAQVRAVGTVFSVVRNAEAVVVTVTEGRVKVTLAANGANSSQQMAGEGVSLKANERVIVSAHGIASPVRHLDSVRILDWGDNRLIFDDRTVADVIKQFNRRNTVKIRIDDAALAGRTVSGIFDASDPQSFVDFLESIAGTTSKRDGGEIIVITGASGAGPIVPGR